MLKRYRVIEWNEGHSTLIRWDTRGRRSRRTRRLWRAARRGDLVAAWTLMVGSRYKALAFPGEDAHVFKLARPIMVPIRHPFGTGDL